MNRQEKLTQTTRPRLVIINPCRLIVKPTKQLNMKNQVTSLMTKTGDTYIVRTTDSAIVEVISINSKKPDNQTVPNGSYQTEGGLMVRVAGNKITTVMAGIQPSAKRKPLSGVALSMAKKTEARKKELSELRKANKI